MQCHLASLDIIIVLENMSGNTHAVDEGAKGWQELLKIGRPNGGIGTGRPVGY
jgi:hypothetical protein